MNKKYIIIGIVVVLILLFLILAPKKPKIDNSGPTETREIEYGVNTEWKNPQRIEVIGYDRDAMEIGVSPDETMLFWNDKQAGGNKDLHWATRIDDLTYQYEGEIQNVNTFTVDASPVMDSSGKLYYTSTFNHDALNNNDIYEIMFVADFENGKVIDPQPLTGNIYVEKKNWFSIDTAVSPDGDTIYFSQGFFGGRFPTPFNIMVAERISGNEYKIKEGILDNINTNNLEYAPSISIDGLELFFTRLPLVGDFPDIDNFGIYVAKRSTSSEAFGIPDRIDAITGEVEAPQITDGGKSLYYHKKDGGKFRIYKVTREEKN